MYTLQALQILIFLIPGFIAAAILNHLVVRGKEQKDLTKFVEALILTMLIYTAYSFISGESPIAGIEKDSKIINYSYDGWLFLYLMALSVGFPIIISIFITHDLHMKIARRLRITKSTSRCSVWFDVFYDVKGYVIINFVNSRRIYGWPQYYSNNPEKPFVYLYDPSWISEKNEFVSLNIEGLLITPEQKIESIEFLGEEPNNGENNGEERLEDSGDIYKRGL